MTDKPRTVIAVLEMVNDIDLEILKDAGSYLPVLGVRQVAVMVQQPPDEQ